MNFPAPVFGKFVQAKTKSIQARLKTEAGLVGVDVVIRKHRSPNKLENFEAAEFDCVVEPFRAGRFDIPKPLFTIAGIVPEIGERDEGEQIAALNFEFKRVENAVVEHFVNANTPQTDWIPDETTTETGSATDGITTEPTTETVAATPAPADTGVETLAADAATPAAPDALSVGDPAAALPAVPGTATTLSVPTAPAGSW